MAQVGAIIRDDLAEEVREQFDRFIRTFSSDDSADAHTIRNQIFDYMAQIDTMKDGDRGMLYVNFEHIAIFSQQLADAIGAEYTRFEPYLRRAVQEVIRSKYPDFVSDPEKGDKEFYLGMYGLAEVRRMRQLNSSFIGRLTTMSGTVTRTSEVRPELMFGSFRCNECHTIFRDVEQQFKYTEPLACKNPACSNRTSWTLNVEQSKFVDYQRIRVQENTGEIPSGSMPRSMDIILRHEAVEKAKAGDKCFFTGQLIVVPDIAQLSKPGDSAKGVRKTSGRGKGDLVQEGVTGLKALGVRDMTYKLAFLACTVQQADARTGIANIRDEGETIQTMSDEDRREINQMKDMPELYGRLTNSIVPFVYGHDDIKRGILLMLFGGVHKQTEKDKIKLRGDINVCIVGDPSTAKSQFLKYVVGFLPRAVYTSGKASTAAGLTASVVRDSETGEFCIEAGALMLADNGICCIDEFDKMDLKDQVAIHEAMEQQTISIAKAGIQATLNARTSILAAANPISGRYDKTKPLKSNVALTPPIMSRFDLFFVVLDECNDVTDYAIARHIVSLHQNREVTNPDFSTEQLQKYIRYARTIKPQFVPEAKALIVENFRKLRGQDSATGRSAYRITVRQLESMIRLSEALARAHLDDKIRPAYVKEAASLLRKSIIHVETEAVELPDEHAMQIDQEGNGEGNGAAAGGEGAAGGEEGAPAPQRQATRIPFDEYRRMANMLVHHLRRPGHEATGLTRQALVDWYVEERQNLMEESQRTEEAIEHERTLVNHVIHRLITMDSILLELGENEDVPAMERLLIVHPNYDPTTA